MAFQDFKDMTMRKAVSALLDKVLNDAQRDREKTLLKIIDLSEKLMGDRFRSSTFESARKTVRDPDAKWMKFANALIDETDRNVLKTHALNLGYQAGFYGFQKTRALSEQLGCNIPWIILMDPTSACNMRCTGCWAAEYGHKMSLSYEDLDCIVTQGEALGIYFYPMTGGEPLMRKADILRLAEKHRQSIFHLFTNGTLIDQPFCDEARRLGNLSFSLSVEGFEETNDLRRGKGAFQKTIKAMALLKGNGLLFGASVCYTSKNYVNVTHPAFLDLLTNAGTRFVWYFHYMPVGNGADVNLLLSPEQRAYMYYRVREIRKENVGSPIFPMDFQNDGEYVGGCIAGGRFYCHINPNGDVEPCVFIHYSGANIHEKSLLECLQQPLFMKYREGQPFNENPLRPCPMLENPEVLLHLVNETGAVSTDMQSPETAWHLCEKCRRYADEWAPAAKELIRRYPPNKPQRNVKLN